MKKTYIKPQTTVVTFQAEGTLMTMSTQSDGSANISRGTTPITDPNQILEKEAEFEVSW